MTSLGMKGEEVFIQRAHIRGGAGALEGVVGGLADAAEGGIALGDGLARSAVRLGDQDARPLFQWVLVRTLGAELQRHRLHARISKH